MTRGEFISWAKHLDSDGYFGALAVFDELMLPLIWSLKKIDDAYPRNWQANEARNSLNLLKQRLDSQEESK